MGRVRSRLNGTHMWTSLSLHVKGIKDEILSGPIATIELVTSVFPANKHIETEEKLRKILIVVLHRAER